MSIHTRNKTVNEPEFAPCWTSIGQRMPSEFCEFRNSTILLYLAQLQALRWDHALAECNLKSEAWIKKSAAAQLVCVALYAVCLMPA